MLMDVRIIAAETRSIEYLQDHYDEFFVSEKPAHEVRTFDLPKSIWRVMFLAYAMFFLAVTVATGRDRSALFMIVISASYAVMYFGTAAAMNAVGAQGRPATVPGDIATATGKLSYGAAFAQILTVPLVIAFFGCAMVVVRAIVAP
jgi:hypothetical protein